MLTNEEKKYLINFKIYSINEDILATQKSINVYETEELFDKKEIFIKILDDLYLKKIALEQELLLLN